MASEDERIRVCPKTGRPLNGIPERRWKRWLFPVTALAAMVWFLIRVVPKPSRASYPCQRAAMPIMASFITWLLGTIGSFAFWHSVKNGFRRMKPEVARLMATAALVAGTVFSCSDQAAPSLTANDGGGVSDTQFAVTDAPPAPTDVPAASSDAPFAAADAPATVVDAPAAAKDTIAPSNDAPPAGTDANVPTDVIPAGRVAWVHNPAAAQFAGAGNWWADAVNPQGAYDIAVEAAVRNLGGWTAMFRHTNQKRYGQDRGYQAGDKIGIKINQNNAGSHTDSNIINGNPATSLALVRSLIDTGVPQADVFIGDPSRAVTANIYNKIKAAYPGVHVVDHNGGDGREAAAFEGNIQYSGTGQGATKIATMFTRSRYVIDVALLKGHDGQGVTLCGKNFFGATNISTDYRNNSHNGFNPGGWAAFADFLGHPDLGGKTVLFLIDAMYPTQSLDGTPSARWAWPPFNGGWPASLFASQDPVAVDSVGMDFFNGQWSGAQDWYLKEAAARGLGLFEHWNNKTNKKYLKINLVYVPCSASACAAPAAVLP